MNFVNMLNIKELEISDDKFLMKIELTDFHAQPLGYLNGGITLAYGEISAGIASNKIISSEEFAVAQSISANHLKSIYSKGDLFARGLLLHKGKSSHVWQISISDGINLISNITVQNSIIKKRKIK